MRSTPGRLAQAAQTPTMRSPDWRPRVLPLALALSLCLAACAPAVQTPSPTGTPVSTAEAELPAPGPWGIPRLAPPAVPADASQADFGAHAYYQICMACHGDRGQGLTDEWREVYGEDSNCWRSRCHAANHPPEGFDLPRNSPALLGAGTLLSYPNAFDLYTRIVETMPWWKPESLSEQQAWGLTAYLMRARNELPEHLVLDSARAPVIGLHQTPAARGDERPGVVALIGLLVVAAIALAWREDRQP